MTFSLFCFACFGEGFDLALQARLICRGAVMTLAQARKIRKIFWEFSPSIVARVADGFLRRPERGPEWAHTFALGFSTNHRLRQGSGNAKWKKVPRQEARRRSAPSRLLLRI